MIFDSLAQARDVAWHEMAVGDSVEFQATCTRKDVEAFRSLSGDINPLHLDDATASDMGYPERVVYGMLASSFFSTLVGTYLPGKHAVYLSQTLQFKKPIFIGDRLTVRGVITQKIDSVKTLYLETTILKQKQELAISGEAIVKYT